MEYQFEIINITMQSSVQLSNIIGILKDAAVIKEKYIKHRNCGGVK